VVQGKRLSHRLTPLITTGKDIEITEHKYGSSVVGSNGTRATNTPARFWVKRPSGWKLLHTAEIAAVPKRDFQTVEPTFDNPCK
jgi:hypothetical protein